jgi:hypothetical protein
LVPNLRNDITYLLFPVIFLYRGVALAVLHRYAVFFSKGDEVVSLNPVLSTRQTEGCQVALFNPSQDGYLAYTAVMSNGSGGEIFRVISFNFRIQVIPPSTSSLMLLMAGFIDLKWLFGLSGSSHSSRGKPSLRKL